jgi:hypothetical protein
VKQVTFALVRSFNPKTCSLKPWDITSILRAMTYSFFASEAKSSVPSSPAWQ